MEARTDFYIVIAVYEVQKGDEGKTLYNSATVKDNEDKKIGHGDSDDNPTIEKKDLTVDKTLTSIVSSDGTPRATGEKAQVDDTLTYTITVKNNTGDNLYNIDVIDDLLDVNAKIDLEADGEWGETYTYKVKSSDASRTASKTLTNTVTVEFDGVKYEDSASTTIKKYTPYTPVTPVEPTKPTLNTEDHTAYIIGYEDGTFRPDQPITRAEAMTLINRVLERAVEEDHMLRDMVKWSDNKPDAWYYEAVQEATNSHEYTRLSQRVSGQSFYYEDWQEILRVPDWAALEKAWSTANSK